MIRPARTSRITLADRLDVLCRAFLGKHVLNVPLSALRYYLPPPPRMAPLTVIIYGVKLFSNRHEPTARFNKFHCL